MIKILGKHFNQKLHWEMWCDLNCYILYVKSVDMCMLYPLSLTSSKLSVTAIKLFLVHTCYNWMIITLRSGRQSTSIRWAAPRSYKRDPEMSFWRFFGRPSERIAIPMTCDWINYYLLLTTEDILLTSSVAHMSHIPEGDILSEHWSKR